MHGIGIGEEEPIAGGGQGELMARPVLAGPAVRKGSAADETVARVAGHQIASDLCRAIRGGIIEDEEFEVGIILSEEGGDAIADGALFIPGGDEDRNAAMDNGRDRSERAENKQIGAQSKEAGAEDAEDDDVEDEHRKRRLVTEAKGRWDWKEIPRGIPGWVA